MKKHGVTQASHKQMQEVLSHPLASFLPEQCRKMLLAALPHSLCVASDLRQEMQNMAVTMLDEVIANMAEKLQAAVESEATAVKGSEDQKVELDETVAAAEKTLEEAQAAASEQDFKLQESSEAVLKAKTDWAKREEEQKAGDAELVIAQSSKDEVEAAVAGDFQILKSGECDLEEAKERLKSLEPMMGKLAMDQSLQSAVPSVLLKKPADRGAFDGTVLDELDKCFGMKIADLTKILESAKPESEARAARVAEAKAALEAAEMQQKECSNGVLAAKETQKQAAAGLKVAKAAVADYQPTFEAATQRRDEKREELQNFVNANVDGFTRLKDRLSAKKLKELAAAEAAKAEAEAEAAAAKAAEEAAAQAAQVAAEGAVAEAGEASEATEAAEAAEAAEAPAAPAAA